MSIIVTDKTNDRLLLALREFLSTCATPALPDEMHVIAGYQNSQMLPNDGNDFCVATPIQETEEGTPIQTFDAVNDLVVLQAYHTVVVQVDCYSTTMFDAKDRANTYAVIASSEYGVNLFKQFDVDCQYADGIQNLTDVGDSGQYVSRWSVTLHLGYWKQVAIGQDYFNTANVNVINVDSRFPPK